MYETFTYLAKNTSGNLPEAHLREAERLRGQKHSTRTWPGKGVAESHAAVASPVGTGDVLREADVREGDFGHELTAG